jgi:hypothetical protein
MWIDPRSKRPNFFLHRSDLQQQPFWVRWLFWWRVRKSGLKL